MKNKTYHPAVWRRYRAFYRVDLMVEKLGVGFWATFFASLPWLLAFITILI
jgi:hypothetical protein